MEGQDAPVGDPGGQFEPLTERAGSPVAVLDGVTGGEENERVGADEAPDGHVDEDLGDGTTVVGFYTRQTHPPSIIALCGTAGLVNGEVAQEGVDVIPRVLGGQVSRAVQLVDEVAPVVVLVVLGFGLDEALVQVADARGEDLEARAQVVVVDIEDGGDRG